MHNNINICVWVNGRLADWLVAAGECQGDNFVPILFALFINNLVPEIDSCNACVMIDERCQSLLYEMILFSLQPVVWH